MSSLKASIPPLASVIKGHLVPAWQPTGTARSFICEKAPTRAGLSGCLNVPSLFFLFKTLVTYSLTTFLSKLSYIFEKIFIGILTIQI